jgi:hypothetical protein
VMVYRSASDRMRTLFLYVKAWTVATRSTATITNLRIIFNYEKVANYNYKM